MALSTDEANELAGLQAKYGNLLAPAASAALPTPPPDLLSRAGQTLANVPSQAIEGVGNMLGGLLQTGVPDADQSTLSVPKPFNIAPATTMGAQAIDTVGNVVSSLPQYFLPELAIGKVGAAAGIGEKTLAFLKGAGAAAANAGNEGPANTAEQSALLGTQGLTGFLPRPARAVANLGIAAAAGGLSYANGADTQTSEVNAGVFGALGLLGLIPGAHPNDTIAPTRTAERAASVDSLLPGTETPTGPRNVANPQLDLIPSPDVTGGTQAPALRLDDGSQMELPLSATQNTNPDVTSQPAPSFALDSDDPVLPFSGPRQAATLPVDQTTLSAIQKLKAGGSINDLPSNEFDALTNNRIRQKQPMLIDGQGRLTDEANALLQTNQPLAPQPQGELPWFGKDSSRMVGPQKSAQESAQAIMDLQSKQVPPMKSAEDSANAIMANKVPLRNNTPLDPMAPSLVGKAANNLGIRYDGIEPTSGNHQFTLMDGGVEKPIMLPPDSTYGDLKNQVAQARQPLALQPDVTSQSSVTPTLPPDSPNAKLLLQRAPNETQIVSTAVNPGDGRILVGSRWDEEHNGVGIRHGMDEVPQSQRGFLVHNADGTQTFAHRGDALEIARQSGQLRDATQTQELNSTDLKTASEKGTTGDQPLVQPAAASAEPPPEPPAQPDAPLKASAALSGEPVSAKEPWYMTSDLSHLSSDYQDDAEYIRKNIRTLSAEGDHAGAAYAVEQLMPLVGTVAPDSPQVVAPKNVTSQPKAASWLTDDSVGKARSLAEDEATSLDVDSDTTEERGEAHQGELTNELQTQGNDYEVENDKVGASEYGTDTEDSDALTQVLDEEQNAQAVTKEELPAATAEEAASPQITDADRKEFGDLTDDAPKASDDATGKSETDKLMGLMEMLEKNPESPGLKKAVRQRTGLGIKRRGSRKNAGFIDAGVVRDAFGLLARYSPGILGGGSVGAYYDKENRLRGFLIGAAMGGALQRFGPGYIRMLMDGIPREIKAGKAILEDVTSQPGGKIGDLLVNLAAEDFGATGQGMAAYVRRFTKSFTMTDDAVDAIGVSNLSGIQHQAADAIKLLKPYYGKLSAAERDIYAKYAKEPWYQLHPDGSRKLDSMGNPVLNTGVETKFTMDMAAHSEFAGGAMKARRLIVLQQEMIANSMAAGKYRAAILDSIGKYQTDAFRMFMESKYRPTQAKVDAFLDELQYTKVFPDYDRPMLMKTLQTQLDGIYQNRQLYEGGGGDGDTGTLDKILQGKIRMPGDLEKRLLAAVPGAKTVDEIVTSQRVLPADLQKELTQAIRDRKYMTPAYRDMLGYYNDPVEKTVATMMKLQPAARAASLFDQIATGTDSRSGLPMSLDPADAVQMRSQINAKLSVLQDPKLRAPLEAQLLDLKYRVKLPDSDNLGKLAGRYVPQGMADILPDMNKGVTGGQGLPITHAILDYNRALKAGQTILNPVSHVKWFYNIPILGALSGTGTGWMRHGFNIAREADGDYMGQPRSVVALRMESLGIKDTNIAHSEFNTTAKQALTGYLDSTLVDKFFSHPIVSWAAEKYGLSDNAVRIGTFLKREQSELSRYAPMVARGDTLPDGRVVTSQLAAQLAEKEAVRYTNRYTINYAATPGGIAYIRKMPFVSLYLTYSYHMLRITKNILIDATGTGPYGKEAVPGAIAKLAALSVIPAAIQAAGRAMLSPQDQKDWDRSIALDQAYAQPRYRYPLYRKADGSFKYLDYTAYVPTGDWNMFGRAVMSGDPKQMLAANPIIGTDNTPALNIATEIITGNDSRTGRPINTFGRALDTARQEIAPAFLGGYEFDNLMRALQPNAEGGIGITRLGSGKGYSIGDLLATYLTGLRPTSVNVDWQKHTAVQEAQSQIATEKQFLMDTARSDATDDVKQAATKRYADAVKMIVSHLQWKLGMENN